MRISMQGPRPCQNPLARPPCPQMVFFSHSTPVNAQSTHSQRTVYMVPFILKSQENPPNPHFQKYFLSFQLKRKPKRPQTLNCKKLFDSLLKPHCVDRALTERRLSVDWRRMENTQPLFTWPRKFRSRAGPSPGPGSGPDPGLGSVPQRAQNVLGPPLQSHGQGQGRDRSRAERSSCFGARIRRIYDNQVSKIGSGLRLGRIKQISMTKTLPRQVTDHSLLCD